MNRVHFNLSHRNFVLLDGEGINDSDVEQTMFDILDTIKDLQRNEPARLAYWTGWSANITDETGAVIATVPLGTTSH